MKHIERIVAMSRDVMVCGVLSALIVGCMSFNRAGDTREGSSSPLRPVVVPALTAHVLDAAQLAAVNSIAIDLPSVTAAGGSGALSADEASAVIERVARETMTLKVLGVPRGGGVGRPSPTRRASADAVLRTEIIRFDQRQGSAIGGKPAVVSFRMNLESPAQRSPMWSAQYFLKQEAVSENLLRLGERVGPSGLGAGWRSAMEVFEKGVNAALTDLNTERERQFLAKDRGTVR